MSRWSQTSSNQTREKLLVGTGLTAGGMPGSASAVFAAHRSKKTGAYPKISSRCASVGAAVLLRFRQSLVRRPVSSPKALMVGGCPRVRLRFSASVSNPHWVQSPDDLCPVDPFRLAPSLLGLSPIIRREIILSFLRKMNWSSRRSSGSRAVLRVIADWSLVRPIAFR